MLVEAEVWTVARTDQGNAVLIRPVGGDVAVPIFIGQLEAQSILIGMGNVPMPRPLTHDLFLSVLERMGITIERVEITELKEGTFYAQLILNRNGETVVIDSRPSDSIALAVRDKCPIYISEAVVDEASIAVSAVTDEPAPPAVSKSSKKDSERVKLQKALDKAVEEENYEEAARIRDRLRELSDSSES